MSRFLIHRVITSIITLFLASIVVFIGVRLLPGDPAQALAGESANPEMLEAIREQFGLNQPIIVQYFTYIGQALTGNLGVSTRHATPVADILLARLPVTLQPPGTAIPIGLLLRLTAACL